MSFPEKRASVLVVSKAKNRLTLANVLKDHMGWEVFIASDICEARDVTRAAVETGHCFSTIIFDEGDLSGNQENASWVTLMTNHPLVQASKSQNNDNL